MTGSERPTPLAHLDGDVTPDSRFAANLRAQVVASGTMNRTYATQMAEPVAISSWRPRSINGRQRLFNLAAVAVLLLTMIGAIARTTERAVAPTDTHSIVAPDVNAVIANGSQMANAVGTPETASVATPVAESAYPVAINMDPSNGGEISGPAPTASAYIRRWQNAMASGTSGAGDIRTVTWNSLLYYYGEVDGHSALVAANPESGAIVWSAPVTPLTDWLVTDQGVIVLVPGETETGHMRLVRLDLATGDQIWKRVTPFDPPADLNQIALSLSGDNIIITTSNGFWLYGFANGSHGWGGKIGSDNPPATPAASDCSDSACTESTIPTTLLLASDGTHTFFANPLSGGVLAFSNDTGRSVWTHPSISNSVDDQMRVQSLVMTGRGLLVLYQPLTNTQSGDRVELVSSTDGSTIWSNSLSTSVGNPVLVGANAFAVAQDVSPGDAGTCCRLVAYTLTDGSESWRVDNLGNGLPVGYLTSTGALLYQQTTSPKHLLGIGSTSHAVDWEFANPDPQCAIAFAVLPVHDDGSMACFGWGGALTYLDPAPTGTGPATATPQPASTPSPVASSPVVLSGQTNGLGQSSAFLSDAQAAEPRWSLDGDMWLSPGLAIIGSVMYSYIWTDSAQTQIALVATGVESGDTIWSVPVTSSAPPVITDQGIIVIGAADGNVRGEAALLRLDLSNGHTIWQSDTLPESSSTSQLVLDGNTIIFDDGTSLLHGFDFSTGAERWQSPYDNSVNPALLDQVCIVSGTDYLCLDRNFGLAPIVAADGVFYIASVNAGTVTALSEKDGSQLWQASIGDQLNRFNFYAIDPASARPG